MATETFTTVYIADASAFVAGSRQVEQSLARVDLAVARTKATTNGLFSPLSRSASGAARSVDKLNNSLNGVVSPVNAAKASLNGINAAARGAAGGMNDFSEAARAVHIAQDGLRIILDLSKEIEQEWKRMAKEAAEFRESLRELAFIRDKTGPDNNVVADVLDFSLTTGMMPEQAREFAESYENIGPTVRAKGHYKPAQGTKDQLEKDITQEVGRTAQRVGLDGKAAGEALGTAGLAHTFTSVEQAMDIFGGAIKGLTDGKVDVTKGVRALSKASAKLVDPKEAAEAGSLPGRIGSYDEAGIYMGVMSLGGGTPDQASHRMVQNSRVLNPASEEGQKAMVKAGITPQMDDPRRLIALSRYFKANKVQDVKGWLRDNKIGSESTREGIEASLKEAERLDQQLKANKATPAGKKTIEDNEKFIGVDRAASSARSRSVEKVVEQVRGEEAEPLERAKKFAATRRSLQKQPHAVRMFQDASDLIASTITYPLRGVSGSNNALEQSPEYGVIPRLKSEGRKYNVDVAKEFPGVDSNDYRTRAIAVRDAEARIKKLGGDPFGEKQVEAEARKQVQEMRPAAPAGGGAGGAGNGAAAAAPGQKVASIDAQKFDQAVGQLAEVTRGLASVTRNLANGRPAPGGDLGGSYGPIRT